MMERLKVIPTTPAVLRQRHASSAFKVCPLCDALNLKENDECYVCRWWGDFDHGPALVASRLQDVINRCPDLIKVIEVEKTVRPSGLTLVWNWLRARFRRRFDIRV
jgi:hypothetical protein